MTSEARPALPFPGLARAPTFIWTSDLFMRTPAILRDPPVFVFSHGHFHE
jgi:hypothetical protein